MDLELLPLRFTIIADGFHRTTSESLFAGGLFLRSLRLFENERITILVRAAEAFRGGVATDVAIDTRGVDVITAGYVFFNFVVSIWQGFGLGVFVLGFGLAPSFLGWVSEGSKTKDLGMRHLFRFHQLVKLLASQES